MQVELGLLWAIFFAIIAGSGFSVALWFRLGNLVGWKETVTTMLDSRFAESSKAIVAAMSAAQEAAAAAKAAKEVAEIRDCPFEECPVQKGIEANVVEKFKHSQ